MSATTSETMLTAAEAKAMSEKANKGYYGDFTKLENILNVIKSKATMDGVTNVEIWYHSDSSEPSELITTLEDLGYEVSWSDCWSCLTIFWFK